MKKVIIGLLIMFAASTAYAELSFQKAFEAKMGNVTFNHLVHKTQDCEACHTAVNANNGVNKDFGHHFCKDCHKATTGPTKCKECHVK